MKRRVVITGMGVLSPVGNTVDEMWEALLAGKNGIDKITQFDASNMKVQIAGEVKNFEPEKYLDPKEFRKMDRTLIFGLVAATQAYQDSGLENVEFNKYRFGTFVTSGIGGINTIKEEAIKAYERGGDRVSPFFIPHSIINMVGGVIAIKFGAKGPNLPVVTACSAGTNAIGEAFRYIRDGYIDVAFAGGSEAPINELSIGGFASMRALNTNNDPDNASIPFDKNRSGFVVAEGCGVVVLEEYEHAKKRGAKIYCEVIGYGSTCDAFHITAPDESAEGITNAIKLALQDAKIEPEKIDYINPHGTSTPYNDRLETLGIKKALGVHAYNVNISATKSMTGHALGAVGAIEAIITAKTLQEGIITPTINLRTPDEECDLNYTVGSPVKRDVKYALSNSVGFGGQNATLVFKKFEEGK